MSFLTLYPLLMSDRREVAKRGPPKLWRISRPGPGETSDLISRFVVWIYSRKDKSQTFCNRCGKWTDTVILENDRVLYQFMLGDPLMYIRLCDICYTQLKKELKAMQ